MEKERALTVDKVKAAALNFASARVTDALRGGLAVTEAFEPGFMRRARQRRRHLARIAKSEAEADRVVLEKREVQARRKKWHELERIAVAARDRRVSAGAPTAKINRDVEDVVAAEERMAEAQHFKERSLATLEQRTNDKLNAEAKAEARARADLAVLRGWREEFWTKNAEGALEQAEALIEDSRAERLQTELELEAFDDAEMAERDAHRTFDQVAGPAVSDDPSGLGK